MNMNSKGKIKNFKNEWYHISASCSFKRIKIYQLSLSKMFFPFSVQGYAAFSQILFYRVNTSSNGLCKKNHFLPQTKQKQTKNLPWREIHSSSIQMPFFKDTKPLFTVLPTNIKCSLWED